MRVAYICADPGVPVFGTKGSSVHVQEIVRAWRRAGAEVTVYCTRRGTERPADLADLPVVATTVGAVAVLGVRRWPLRTRAVIAAVLLAVGFCLKVYPGIFVLPLIAWCYWIGLYPKPHFDILEKPVGKIVERVHPGYYQRVGLPNPLETPRAVAELVQE